MEAEETAPWYSPTILISVTAPGVLMHTAASFGQNNAEACFFPNSALSALGHDSLLLMSSLLSMSYLLAGRRDAKLPLDLLVGLARQHV